MGPRLRATTARIGNANGLLVPPPWLRAPWNTRAPPASSHAWALLLRAQCRAAWPCGAGCVPVGPSGGYLGKTSDKADWSILGEGLHTHRGGVHATDTPLLRTHRLRDHARRCGYQANPTTQDHGTRLSLDQESCGDQPRMARRGPNESLPWRCSRSTRSRRSSRVRGSLPNSRCPYYIAQLWLDLCGTYGVLLQKHSRV